MSLFNRPVVPLEAQAREDHWNADKEACLTRFKGAVAASKGRDHRQSEAIIASVRERHGDKAAEIAASELKKAVRHEVKQR
jgi:hypothetical protein